MKYSCFDLFGLSYIPEVLAEVSTSSSCYIHLSLIFVTAIRAYPLKLVVDLYLALKTAYMTVISTGIELSILYVVIDIFNKLLKCRKVIPKVRYLSIRDSTT
jgi:hypothetical protein